MRQSMLFSILFLGILLSGIFPVIHTPSILISHSGSVHKTSIFPEHKSLAEPLSRDLSDISKQSTELSTPLPAPSDIQAILDPITPSSYRSIVSRISNSFGSRIYGSPGNGQAVEYVSDQFEKFGLLVTHHEFSTGQPNVIGTLQGGSLNNNECIIVGAHIDTYPAQSPGADDNGSGIAAVLEMARVMSQYTYNYTILFVAFNSEEAMIAGSNALASDLLDNNVSIAVMYNFDMIMWDSPLSPETIKTNIVHNGGSSAAFAQHAADIGQSWVNAPVQSFLEPYWVQSDHSAFWSRNIPAVWFFEYDGFSNPYIHSIQDSTSQSEYSYEIGTLATKTAAAAVADFATIVSNKIGFPNINFITPTKGDFIPPDNQIPIVLSIADAQNDVEHLELSIDGRPWINATAGLNSTHCEYFMNTTNIYGTVTVNARAYDAKGWIARSFTSFVVDKGISCNIFTPTEDETLIEGEETTIWINVTDPDGRYIPSVEVRINQSSWQRAYEHIRNQAYYYNWVPFGSGSVTIEVKVVDGNGNRNSSMVSVVVSNYPPIISGVWIMPPNPLDSDPIHIYSEITQDSRGSGIDRVMVFYSVDYSTWHPKLMEQVDSEDTAELFMVNLNAFPAGSQLRFYIQAQDNYGNVVIDDNEGFFYTSYVSANLTLVLFAAGVVSIVTIFGVTYYILKNRRRFTPTPT